MADGKKDEPMLNPKDEDNKLVANKPQNDDEDEPVPEDIEHLVKSLDNIDINSVEELQELLNNLAGSPKGDGKKTKKISLISRIVKNPIINFLIYLAINMSLTVAIDGYLHVFTKDAFYMILLYSFGFTLLDILIREILYWKIPFVVIGTFGLLTLATSICSMLFTQWVLPGISFNEIGRVILYIVILIVARFFLARYLTNYIMKHKYPMKRGKKK